MRSLFLLLAIILIANPVFAESASALPQIVLPGYNFLGTGGYNTAYSTTSQTGSGGAGLFKFNSGSIKFDAVCLDPFKPINIGLGNPHGIDYNFDQSGNNGAAYLTGPNGRNLNTSSTNLIKLWANYYGTIGNDATKAAAFQLAAWELHYENTLSISNHFTTGVFTLSGTAGAVSQADTWLTAIANGTANASVAGLSLVAYWPQDYDGTGTPNSQLLITVVPEPGFYGVLALGLSGLFVAFRRRKD